MLSVEIISEFLTSARRSVEEHPAAERPLAELMLAALAPLLPLAQGDDFVRDAGEATPSCVAENDTVCLGWAIDNFDRYVDPDARAPRPGRCPRSRSAS